MSIHKFFSEDSALQFDVEGNPISQQLVLAVILTLSDSAGSDGTIDSVEFTKMVEAAADSLGLRNDEIGGVVEVLEFLKKDKGALAKKSDELFESVRQSFSVNQRQQILGLAWKVLYADKKISSSEATSAVELRKKLGLSLEEAMWARSVALEEIESPKSSLEEEELEE